LEVLVATMHRTDFSLAEQMHLTCPAVIANQCGQWKLEEQLSPRGKIRMLSSDTVGVGVNRNLALQLATEDILLFADDDIAYYDGALAGVEQAFRDLPEADVIFFAIDMTREGKVFDERRNRVKRLHLWNSLRYGACRMAIRREAVIRHRLTFSTLFGGGCLYGSGEDTLFIRDCFRAGLKVYSHDLVLGACAKDSSTWFHGFDEKYMFDKGALLACAFPRSCHLVKWHFVRRFLRKSDLPLRTIVRCIDEGIKSFPQLRGYTPAETGERRTP